MVPSAENPEPSKVRSSVNKARMDQLVHRRFDLPQVSGVGLHAVCGIVDAETVVPSAEKPEL